MSLNRTQPSTPSPPARETAAATCSEGVKAKIGCSMPKRSQRVVRTEALLVRGGQTHATLASVIIFLAATYCALPVALRGTRSTRVRWRGSL